MFKKITVAIGAISMVLAGNAFAQESKSPNIYGTVSIKVNKDPNAFWIKRYNEVINQPITVRGEWDDAIAFAKTLADNQKLDYINRWVNKHILFKVDGKKDTWDTANTALTRRTGDCEEFVITKYQMLKEAGFPDSKLYVTVGYASGQGHAILVAEENSGMFVKLENGNSNVELTRSDLYSFEPKVALNEFAAWVWK